MSSQNIKSPENDLDELCEILARGYLRIILSKSGNRQDNSLNQLDKTNSPSDQLDRKLTAAKKRRKV